MELDPDELAIIIQADGSYQVIVPKSWADDQELPEFAFLAVAAILRLSSNEEVAFAKQVSDWADVHLKGELITKAPSGKPN